METVTTMVSTSPGQIEIPQRNSAVLSFTSEAREALAVKRRDFITLLGGRSRRARSSLPKCRGSVSCLLLPARAQRR